MKKWLVAILFGTLLVLGACGGGGSDDSSKDKGGSADKGGEVALDGEEIYKNSCAGCHANDLTGTSGPDLTKVGADHTAEDIEAIIAEGPGSMPPGVVKGDEAKAVAEWLATHK